MSSSPSRNSVLTGTFQLTRLALRRDRVLIPVWAIVIAGFAAVTASSFASLYPTLASRVPFIREVQANTGLIALVGDPFDLSTIGGMTAWRFGSTGVILTIVMSYLLVTRHTRAEEEADRLELLRAQAIGVLAPLTAGLLTVAAANIGVAVLVVAGLLATGLPLAGSLALALALAGSGMVFASVAAVAAQLTRSGRTANGISSALLGAAFLLRAAGDSAGPDWLSWLSPVGWAQRLRAFAGDRWWVLLVDAAAIAVLLVLAYRLAAGRDLGDGVVAERPGPARGASWLRTPGALAWRLQRGSLFAWAAGFAVFGLVLGGLAQSVADLTDGSPQLADLLTSLGGRQSVIDAFLISMLGISAIITGAYTVQSMLRLNGEESGQRAEPLLALPVRRVRWALGHVVISLAGTAVLLLVLGLAMGLAMGLSDRIGAGDVWGELPRVTGAALAQVPAAWVLGGVTMLVYGVAPRWAPVTWVTVLAAFFLNLVGPLAGFSQWALDISPFTHLPKLPGAPMTWTPLIWLTLITLGLCAAGLAALNRRDLT